MAEYIRLTEELKLSMRAGARSILNTKKYHGSIYISDVFSDSPKEMPYLQAAEILYTASEKGPEDVAPVVHGRWVKRTKDCVYFYACSECGEPVLRSQWGNDFFSDFCPNCGAKMDLEEQNDSSDI